MRRLVLTERPGISPYLTVQGPFAPVAEITHAGAEELFSCPDSEPIPEWLREVAIEVFSLQVPRQPTCGAILAKKKPRGPYRVTYEISQRCNFRCPHCYLGEKSLTTNSLQVNQIVDQLIELQASEVGITGGEATAAPAFPTAYRRLYESGCQMSLLTNGSLIGLDSKLQSLLRDFPPAIVKVGIYGATEEDYRNFTGNRFSFRDVINSLDFLQSIGANVVLTHVHTAESGSNPTKISDYFMNRFGLDVRLSRDLIPNLYAGTNPLSLEADTADGVGDSPFWSPPRVDSAAPGERRCVAGTDLIHVGPNGRISMCSLARSLTPDRFIQDGVAWIEQLRKESVEVQQMPSECSDCSISSRCAICVPIFRLYQSASRLPGSCIKASCDV